MPDKDDQIKKAIEEQVEDDLLKKQTRLKDEAQQDRTLHRAAKSETKHAKSKAEWDTFSEHVKERIKSGQQGYDTWVAAMSSIVILCKLFVNAADASNPLGSLLSWGAGKTSDIYHRIADGAKVTDQEVRESLPDLLHYVQFTDDDKLNIASLSTNMRRTDGRDFPPQVKEVFEYSMKEGMKIWLGNNGYQLRAGTGDVFEDSHGTQLTKDAFEALRDDPDAGLDEFLTGRFDMNFQRSTGPKPSP